MHTYTIICGIWSRKSVINDFFSEVNIFLVICKNLVEKIIFLKMDLKEYLFLISLVSPWRYKRIAYLSTYDYEYHLTK